MYGGSWAASGSKGLVHGVGEGRIGVEMARVTGRVAVTSITLNASLAYYEEEEGSECGVDSCSILHW